MSIDTKTISTYLSEKASKIRWKPEKLADSLSFLTGSWDNEINHIKLWSQCTSEIDDEVQPMLLIEIPFQGDVTELKFLNDNTAVASSTEGYINFLRVENDYNGLYNLEEIKKFKKLHYFKSGENSSCTAFDFYDDCLLTIGEDARINLIDIQRSQVVSSIEKQEECSLKCVNFIKHNEAVTGNSRGQLKLWDLRLKNIRHSFSMYGQEQNIISCKSATCITTHPSQRHVIIVGSENGGLAVWDLRKTTMPITLFNAHDDSVVEIKFHPTHPDILFSSSLNGELWQWNSKLKIQPNKFLNIAGDDCVDNVWLNNDLSKDKLEVVSLMPKLYLPVNSLDVCHEKLLCVCDNEALYLILNLNI